MYKTYHYDNMPIIRNNSSNNSAAQSAPPPPSHQSEQFAPKPECAGHETQTDSGGILHNFFGNFNNDDIILLVIIFILLLDNCEDKLLLAALGFIFFSGLAEK